MQPITKPVTVDKLFALKLFSILIVLKGAVLSAELSITVTFSEADKRIQHSFKLKV